MLSPSIRQPFWSASSKERPIAITSPTDFISLPMKWDAPRNLSRSHFGIFTTR